MKKGMKPSIWRGLMSIFAVLLAFLVGAGSIAQTRAEFINGKLGTSNYKTIKHESDNDGTYFDSEFGSVEELVGELQNVATEIASEGAVLLKNESGLPIDKTSEKVTLWGLNSQEPILGGLVGSSVAYDPGTEQKVYGIEEALAEKGFDVNSDMMDFYNGDETAEYRMRSQFFGQEVPGHSLSPIFWAQPVGSFEYFVGEAPADLYDDKLLASADDSVALVVISRDNSEAADYSLMMHNTTPGDNFERVLALSDYEREMIKLAKEHSSRVIVLLNADSPMEIRELKEDDGIASILWIGAPGMYGMLGVADILSGLVNPSGCLPDTYVSNVTSNPAMANFGVYLYDNSEYSETNAVLTEANKANWFVVETEGIYVGYKYYETRYEDSVLGAGNADSKVGSTSDSAWDYGTEMVYPFGFGLSYTTFEQTLKDVTVEIGGEGKAEVEVTNTGDVAGKSVVQLYVQAPYTEGGLEKAAINLIGYGKTSELEPGASETVTVTFDPAYIASYDQEVEKADGTKGAWTLDAGTYYFAIGNGAHEAINNVLASKTGSEDGLFINKYETVNADNVKTWEVADTDTETYSVNVQNALQDADINNLIPGTAEYMTRSDWSKGWTTIDTLTPTDEMMVGLTNNTYSLTDNPGEVVWGADNGLKLCNFILTDEEGNFAGVVDFDDPQWDALMDQITFDEAVNYIEAGGDDLENIDSIGAPRNYMNDGPIGFVFDQVGGYSVRWTESNSDEPTYVGGDSPYAKYSMAVMPTAPVVAATFNQELIEREGEMLGEESLWANESSIMAPGANLHRSPYCARNHEYYSEDPMLVNLCCVAVCKGGLSKGLMMEPKHLAFNHQEMNRSGMSTFLTEQAGRETELRGFQGCLAGNYARFVMTAFNRVGTVFAGADEGVQVQILRNEWGYTGGIITDMINGADYMNWKDSIYGGGSTMLANASTYDGTEWGSMSSNKSKIQADSVFQQKMKEALKYCLYATAGSNAMNGVTSDVELVYVRTWWQNALTGATVAVGVLTALFALLYVLRLVKSRKEQ